MQPVDRTGWFRCRITDYGLEEAESGSVAVKFLATLTEMWDRDAQSWEPWEQYEMEAQGNVWIIKKDGKPNQKAVESLCKCCDWDGTLASIAAKTWEPPAFQGEVKAETYREETRYRIEWLAAFDATPGAGTMSAVDDNKLKALEAKYGSQLRGIAGNFVRNKPKPPGDRPPAPPPVGAAAGNSDDGIRF